MTWATNGVDRRLLRADNNDSSWQTRCLLSDDSLA